MSRPRRALPGATYHLSRRCVGGQFLLTPSKQTNQLFLYLLAVCAERYMMKVHMATVMSNHDHIVLTDPNGRIADFCRDLGALTARSLNRQYDRQEAVWSCKPVSRQELHTAEDVMDKLVYTALNPVKADLVEIPEQWPGVRILSKEVRAGRVEVSRPDVPFFTNSKLPKSAVLKLSKPHHFEDVGKEEYLRQLDERIGAGVRELRLARRAKRKKVLGAVAIKAQSIYDTPSEPTKKRSISPQLACKNKVLRIRLLKDLRRFRDAYQEAKAKWLAGVTDVLFPAGTQLMDRLPGARCESRPPGLALQGL